MSVREANTKGTAFVVSEDVMDVRPPATLCAFLLPPAAKGKLTRREEELAQLRRINMILGMTTEEFLYVQSSLSLCLWGL
jgi:hypothetical protein